MAARQLIHVGIPSETYYAFPLNGSLATNELWLASRVLLTIQSGNVGKYTATIDDDANDVWYVFNAAERPASWADRVAIIDLSGQFTTVKAAARAGVEGLWRDETGATFRLTITD